jgi:hypothetical protein
MKEKRFYLIDNSQVVEDVDVLNLTNEKFIREAERQGTVYTQDSFVEAFNDNYVSADTQYLRIIDVEM